MLTKKQAEEILHSLKVLPPEKISEVQDFILFLKDRYGPDAAVDISQSWSEEDLRDLTAEVLKHADPSL